MTARPPPTSLRIRAYNVGFGDCFLLTFRYAAGRRPPRPDRLRHHGPARQPQDADHGGRSPRTSRTECGGKLDMVVATHRHTDHISGFAGAAGEVIADARPRPGGAAVDRGPRPGEPTPPPRGAPSAVRRRHVGPGARMRSGGGPARRHARGGGPGARRRRRGWRPSAASPPPWAPSSRSSGEENIKNRGGRRQPHARWGRSGSTPAHGTKLPIASRAAGGEDRRARAADAQADRGRSSSQATHRSRRVLAPGRHHRPRRRRPADGARRSSPRPSTAEADPPGGPLAHPQDRPDERRGAAVGRPHPRRGHEQHQPHPAVRGRGQAAALPGRRPDRELALRPAGRARRRRHPGAAGGRPRVQGRPPRQPQRHPQEAAVGALRPPRTRRHRATAWSPSCPPAPASTAHRPAAPRSPARPCSRSSTDRTALVDTQDSPAQAVLRRPRGRTSARPI